MCYLRGTMRRLIPDGAAPTAPELDPDSERLLLFPQTRTFVQATARQHQGKDFKGFGSGA